MSEELKEINEVDELVEKAQVALEEFLKLDQDQVDYIVAKCSVAGLDHHGSLAKLAVDETPVEAQIDEESKKNNIYDLVSFNE